MADGEEGLTSEEFTDSAWKASTLHQTSVAYAPWQKGQCERMIQTMKGAIRKSVLRLGLAGPLDMRAVGFEAASASNQRPGPSGVSPARVFFGQRLRLYGDLYEGGRPTTRRPDAEEPQSDIAHHVKSHNATPQAIERQHANGVVSRAVSVRSGKIENAANGSDEWFYL